MCRSEARECASVIKRRHLQRQASPACLQRVALRAARWGCRTARKPAPCTSCTCHASEGQPQDRSMQSGDIGKGQSRRGTKSAEHNLKSATLTGARIEPSIAGASQPQPPRKEFRPTCTPPSLRAPWWGPGAVGFWGLLRGSGPKAGMPGGYRLYVPELPARNVYCAELSQAASHGVDASRQTST